MAARKGPRKLYRYSADVKDRMTRHRYQLVLAPVLAVATAALSADETPATTRAEYDAFMGAFSVEQHRASCERRAPEVYAAYCSQADSWRAENDAMIRRLEAAAHQWELPGGRLLDDLLSQIATSTDDDYASMTNETREVRCKALIHRLTA
jgi:hypothetical protein